MDFTWSKDQQALREAVVELARAELNEGLHERDEREEFNRAGWDKLAAFGIHGMPFPVEYGGGGLDALTTVGVLERLGYGCRDNGLVFSVNAHMWTVGTPLMAFGTDEQKQRLLPRLCSGELVGANAMSEHEAGSDAYSLGTTATLRGDRYLLSGSKTWVTNGPIADVIVVFATVDASKGPNGISAFMVERGSKGLSVGGKLRKMGIRTSPMSELFFDDCEVPVENRLGREGAGKSLFTHSMTWERACILSSAVGSMERLLETSIAYARRRKQFGQSIGKFQMLQSRVVDMKLRLEAARSALYQAAFLRDAGRSIFLEAAIAKLQISESWVRTAEDALQIHGGYGYMRESEIERELRDAIGSRLYSGTSEIQRTIIASLLGL
ncbi:MAG: acyl-CoA dehydrogenase family protein [Spirochaetaceae bacterium]|nr:acyl-CoA dehydrogenase family protein [Myxococcales bacterium]MCB9725359.1 acyl-CoA dehydrogenase family protein [Spirochaetaceae bacterium]